MNCEILFRGKRMDNGEWVEGDLLRAKYYRNDIDHWFLFTNAEAFPANEFLGYEEVDPSTVGRYTGLTDKNGVKIFEGDIIKTRDNTVCTVEWDGENARILGFTAGRERRIVYVGREPKVEVIGNIHDNPDLLERDDGK